MKAVMSYLPTSIYFIYEMSFVMGIYGNICRNISISTAQYRGRYFENRTIDSINFTRNIQLKNVFSCSQRCSDTVDCKAITFRKHSVGSENCKLYSVSGLNNLLTFDENKDTIFISQIDNAVSLPYFTNTTSMKFHVGAKDDSSAVFVFGLPTGMYRIRLNHLSGGLGCTLDGPLIPFGCDYGQVAANLILLTKGMRGEVLIAGWEFSEFEGDGRATSFVATSLKFELINNSIYTFWYMEDYNDDEESNNRGTTEFELVVT